MMELRRLWPDKIARDRELWTDFLAQAGLRAERNVDQVYGLFEGEDLIATGSLFHNIIKCVAVREDYQGGPAFNQLISALLQVVMQQGSGQSYVYTKVRTAPAFVHLGFQEISRVDGQLVFLERGMRGLTDFLAALQAKDNKDVLKSGHSEQVGAIVLNTNPLTLGHMALIDYARQACTRLQLFVVAEDLSAFPAADRLALVQEAVADFPEVRVHSTGPYLVSAATFPSYFLPEEENVTRIQARLDAQIFRRYFAPTLGITKRFVGEEPLSPTTHIYNQVMAEVFQEESPYPPLKLEVIPRAEQDGQPISASQVRQYLAQGQLDPALALVPPVTQKYLQSPQGQAIIQKLQSV